MKKTFREKMEVSYRKVAENRRFLKIPAFLGIGLVVLLHDFGFWLIGGWKKYAFTSFLLINILIGSSFAYPVFGERDGFISGEVPVETIAAPESTIELAKDGEINEDKLIYEDDNYLDELEDLDSYSLADILSEREDVMENISDNTEDVLITEDIKFSADDWRLILLNKQHPIPAGYENRLGTITGSMRCDERIIDDLLLMMQRALNDGVELVIRSSYRDIAHQEQLFTRKIDSYIRNGFSYLDAYKRAAQTVTVPGTSEHEVGLALDITSSSYRNLNAGFADTKAGQWLADHSYEYGFILRYPLGKEYVTGIEFEPWHFRYVGREAAKIIKEEQITLEEFWDKYVKI